jgi:hypothetical protein
MATVMALSGPDDDERRPRCKKVKTKNGTRRRCPVERTENGKWRWAFESKSRRTRR